LSHNQGGLIHQFGVWLGRDLKNGLLLLLLPWDVFSLPLFLLTMFEAWLVGVSLFVVSVYYFSFSLCSNFSQRSISYSCLST
jgi:hypothetical protein